MPANRSAPQSAVVPVLTYPDAAAAAAWLCRAFGFAVRVRAGGEHFQLHVDCGDGPGDVMLSGRPAEGGEPVPRHYVFVAVADVDAHCAHCAAQGGQPDGPPQSYPYGERQYAVSDPWGHRWVFSQSVADVAPAEWGAVEGG
jgi:uncharacterized glyoxalase superfamily protein PhnB